MSEDLPAAALLDQTPQTALENRGREFKMPAAGLYHAGEVSGDQRKS